MNLTLQFMGMCGICACMCTLYVVYCVLVCVCTHTGAHCTELGGEDSVPPEGAAPPAPSVSQPQPCLSIQSSPQSRGYPASPDPPTMWVPPQGWAGAGSTDSSLAGRSRIRKSSVVTRETSPVAWPAGALWSAVPALHTAHSQAFPSLSVGPM